MRRILIVEDDRFITAIFTMFIKELGHELIGRCASGIEALEISKKVKPDVVLMDIHLEGELDGIQTSARLQREIGVPVIYVSSDTSTDVIERAVVSNSYGFLVKPINKQELSIAVDLAYYKYKVDQEQKQREQGYREFISDSPMPIILIRDGRILYINNSALDTLKTHYIEDVMGQGIKSFIGEESYAVLEKGIEDLLNKGSKLTPQTVQFRTVHGDAFWCEIKGSKVMFNNQETVQLLLNNISLDNSCLKKEKALDSVIAEGDKYVFRIDEKYKPTLLSYSLKSNLFGEREVEAEISDIIKEVDSFKEQIDKIQTESCESFDIKLVLKNDDCISFTGFPKTCSVKKFQEILFIQQ
ncbi:response regulator [Saccharicrinis aurantiacus]|uniref:response regulator n=1 Tax=Saccharicrinis aurantiacus TaxID=1849719 RepID=UPI000837FC4D|nr:response regulator [Saccharicrinis aurantiacus]